MVNVRTWSRRARVIGVVGVLALVATACGGDDDDAGSAATTAAAPVTTAGAATTATTSASSAAPTTSGGTATTSGDTATTVGDTATTSAATTGGSGPPADAIEVPIGEAFSAGATYGLLDQPSKTGVDMAVQEINDAGGFQVAGKNYKLVAHSVDTTDTPAQATAAFQGLIDQYHPVAIFGPTVSPIAIATQVVANREKTIEVSASTAWSAILGQPETKYLIKTKPPEAIAANMQHEAVFKAFPGMKTSVIFATDEASGHAAAEVWEKDQKDLGMDVSTTYFPPDLTDANSLITKIRDNPPDFITVTGAAQPAMNAVLDKLIQEKIGKVLFSNCNYLAAHKFQAGEPPFTCISIPADLTHTTNPTFKAFAEKYTAFTGKQVDGLSFWAMTQYPYVYALVDAMKKAGTVTDTDKIIEAMHGYESSDHTVTLKIDDRGEATTSMELTIADGDQIKVVNIEPPAG